MLLTTLIAALLLTTHAENSKLVNANMKLSTINRSLLKVLRELNQENAVGMVPDDMALTRERAVGGCEDDATWTDGKFSSGTLSCRDIKEKYGTSICTQSECMDVIRGETGKDASDPWPKEFCTPYVPEYRRGCPASCGACSTRGSVLALTRERAVGGCEDDATWTDGKFSSGTLSCRDIKEKYGTSICTQSECVEVIRRETGKDASDPWPKEFCTPYVPEYRRGCPASCGACSTRGSGLGGTHE